MSTDFPKFCEEVEEQCEEEGKYSLSSIDHNLKLIRYRVFFEDSNWSNALRHVQDHNNFPPWPTAGKFYIFPNKVRCRMVINRNTGALCSWRVREQSYYETICTQSIYPMT